MDLPATTMAAGRPSGETGSQPDRIVFDQRGCIVLHRASTLARAGLSQVVGR
jgi:hypothetical protein